MTSNDESDVNEAFRMELYDVCKKHGYWPYTEAWLGDVVVMVIEKEVN